MSGYPSSTVKKWLNILKREGLVLQHRDGLRVNYTLRGKNNQ
jgi:DNA-binding IclR family transcriptional regulator